MNTNSEPAGWSRALAYWHEGAKIIEACLEKALRADVSDAPFPLGRIEAVLWHDAQANAYRHALEMMGPTEAIMALAPPSSLDGNQGVMADSGSPTPRRGSLITEQRREP